MCKNRMKNKILYSLTLLCLFSFSAGAAGFKTFLEYEDLIRSNVKNAGLPERFCYLPLLLTDCNPDYSDTYTVGAWALAGPVARTYGLTVSETYDARRDMELSTRSAVAYLEALYRQFGRDEQKTLAQYFTVAHRPSLASDPSGAMKKLDRNREELGEFIAPDDCRLDEIKLEGPVMVSELCDVLNAPFSSLKYWNPAISASAEFLPEGAVLRIPSAKADSFRRRASAMYSTARSSVPKTQTPQERSALALAGQGVSASSGTPASTSTTSASSSTTSQRTASSSSSTVRKPASSTPKPIYHTVKKGENLGSIARKYNTSVSKIVKDNRLKSADKIAEGQKLKIYKNVK